MAVVAAPVGRTGAQAGLRIRIRTRPADARAPDTGAEHLLRVYEVQVHPNGDKSWLARVVDGSGEVLPAVFTQGVDSTLGSITTGGGTYSLEAEGRLGWIANVDDLRRHQDFSIPDVMEPGPGEGRAPVPGGR